MKNLALQRIQEMKPYNPPLSGRRIFNGIRLDFNERTVPPSPRIQKAIQNLLKSNTLQMYPEYGGLEQKLAQYAGVNIDQIMITNGSDQGIDLVFRAFTQIGDTVIIPEPSFSMFSQAAQIVGNTILRPLYSKENSSFPTEKLVNMINKSVKLIIICNPNNPTGTLVPIKNIEKIAAKSPNAIILVDEAYFEFSKTTAVSLIKKYQNIVVLRTLSKAFGLSSLRVGYIVASEMYMREIIKIRGPFDVNAIAYTAALAALDDLKSVQDYANEVMNQAKPLVEKFFTKNSISFYQSSGNFLLYRPIKRREEKILKNNGILVRVQEKTNIQNMIRLTIGTTDQMKKFISVYKKVILNNSRPRKYAFIDRDGTLIFEPQDTFQIDSIEKLKILDGTIKGLKKLIEQEYELILVSNQDGLGTSSFPRADFDAPQNRMLDIFEKNDIRFSEIFICPHFPAEKCNCRKPNLGLIEKFSRIYRIDKNSSFVCGDRESDKLFAKNIGIRFVPMPTNNNFYTALKNGGVI